MTRVMQNMMNDSTALPQLMVEPFTPFRLCAHVNRNLDTYKPVC